MYDGDTWPQGTLSQIIARSLCKFSKSRPLTIAAVNKLSLYDEATAKLLSRLWSELSVTVGLTPPAVQQLPGAWWSKSEEQADKNPHIQVLWISHLLTEIMLPTDDGPSLLDSNRSLDRSHGSSIKMYMLPPSGQILCSSTNRNLL